METSTSDDGTLPYTIADSTPHSGRYAPENILVDKPQEQSSRWSGAHQGNGKQWILLRLETPAILKQITFGKYKQTHPCNVKEFKIYVGLTLDNMTQVLHSGLKNNAEPETFNITHVNGAGVPVPTRYVKVEPLSAHGQSYHVSIWHVALKGVNDPSYVEKITATYEEHREVSVLRHILKHLRQRRLLSPYQSIIERADIQLENPLITKLHESLVLQGNWGRAEQLLLSMSDAGLFTHYIHSCEPQAIWTRVRGTDADGDIPSPRGGHAMCMDPENQLIYLFGGWDGRKSLDDFWVYNIREDKWKILSHSTASEHNAPGPRSCHKMVFDTKTGNIYLLGRLNDDDVRMPASRTVAVSTVSGAQTGQVNFNPATGMPYMMAQSPLRQQFTPTATPQIPASIARTYCSEFYRYQTRGLDAGKWVFLSFDTASSGGPPLMFDHQMVMDSEAQILYVSGGRIVDGNWDQAKYSGLYSYNVRLSKWRLLQLATIDPNSSTSPRIIPPRFGHSMVLEPKAKQLYIFGGQREDRYLSDMHVYDIATNTSTELFSNFTNACGPDPCFTQRAVIDSLYKEVYIFCGLTRNPAGASKNTVLRSSTSNWVFRYDTKPGKWFRLEKHPDNPPDQVPVPRFAHQAVYHPETRTVFLHGGNAGGIGGTLATEASTSSGADGSATSSARQTPSPPSEANPAGPGETSEQGESSPKDKRLDDLWMMELRRPGVQEIVRQARFHVRRQQFREMCEQDSPVKALQFLQTEVSSVVDHSSPTEAETFRSLLTHLLAPPSSHPAHSLPARLTRTSSTSSERSGSSTSSLPGSRDPSSSRGDGNSEAASSRWTNKLPGDGDGEFAFDPDANRDVHMAYAARGTAETLRGIIDPLEIAAAKAMANATTPTSANVGSSGEAGAPDAVVLNGPISLTSERYRQRMEVFNSLLRYVSEGEKEPVGDLLDMVNQRGLDDIVHSGMLDRASRAP